jgi:acetyltransferase-like isoleucine patch superfamily enzyme
MSFERVVIKAKQGEGAFWGSMRRLARWVQRVNVPVLRPLHLFLGAERRCRLAAWHYLLRKLYHEPIFKAQCERVGPRLMLSGGLPYILGSPRVILGSGVRMHGGTFIAAAHMPERPVLEVGDESYLGYGLTIRLARRISIGKNCIIADGVCVTDTDGHPLDPVKRAKGEPVEPDQVEPVFIEDHAWIGPRCIILKGVRIGRAAVVGAGSVVTKDVPPFAVCAGNPAKVVKMLDSQSEVGGQRSEIRNGPSNL